LQTKYCSPTTVGLSRTVAGHEPLPQLRDGCLPSRAETTTQNLNTNDDIHTMLRQAKHVQSIQSRESKVHHATANKRL
jgi:hypothetical protein